MIYYSKIVISNESYCRENRGRNAYGDMRLMCRCFGDFGEKKPFLFTKTEKDKCIEFLVVSTIKPFCPDYNPDFRVREIDEKIFLNRSNYRFKLTLNSVKSIVSERSKNEVRVPLKRAEVKEWAIGKIEKNGMKVNSCETEKHYTEPYGKKRTDSKIQKSVVTGTLTVVDEKLFLNALINGIGKSRRSGCGMLLVK